ncbi:MAG: hypothetical protein LBF70_01750 [Holosporales bacterium]|jgi:hypothetical protein|nr:hypothetical protein [Holosporales bacterium]
MKDLKKAWHIWKASFIQQSLFYRTSLNKQHTVFDPNMFIPNPWPGDSLIGKEILDHSENQINLIALFQNLSNKNDRNAFYGYSFAWIKDIQALGGNHTLKYVRYLISTFINNYKNRKKFWLNYPSWTPWIIGERIINWIFAYQFFASGANDSFQKEVLSSINEQFSHLFKIYKGETNLYFRLIVLKAIFFCLCSMHNKQFKHIKRIIKEINEIIQIGFDDTGMFISKSPVDHFNCFKSLLEIRFMSKKVGINFDCEALSKIASCVRFLRLNDGKLSRYNEGTFFQPSRQMIDAALYFVDIKNSLESNISGFERLATKRILLLVNTEASMTRSRFNNKHEPGIDIFTFEASFGVERVINRSDIAVMIVDYYIKLFPNYKYFFNKSVTKDLISFDGEVQQQNQFFNFMFRRNLFVKCNESKIGGSDVVYIPDLFKMFSRFVFNKASSLYIINPKTVSIAVNNAKYIFKTYNGEIAICDNLLNKAYPAVIVSDFSKEGTAQLNWTLEEVE